MTTVEMDGEAEVNFVEEFDPAFESATLESVTIDGDEAPILLENVAADGILSILETVGPGELVFTYEVEMPEDAQTGTSYEFDGLVEIGEEPITIEGDSTLTVDDGPTASFEPSVTVADSATVGEETTIEYSVENIGEAEGSQDVVISVGDTELDTELATLSAGETTTGTLTYTPTNEDVPEVDIRVGTDDESATATLSVESDARGENGADDGDDDDDGFGPGFGVLVAGFAAALLAGYGISRRG